jgi:hypothetical protein
MDPKDFTYFDQREGNRLFKKAGIFVSKSNDFFFSLKSGFSSVIHKHCDENSIILWYKGRYLICDSGSYSYDFNDPVRKFVASTRGHSSIFPVGIFDEEASGSNYCKRVRVNPITYDEKDTNAFSLASGISIDNDLAFIERRIEREDNEIAIIDTYKNKEPLDMRQRFILHPDAEIKLCDSDDVVAISIDNVGVRARIDLRLTSSQRFCLTEGYYSEDYNVSKTCNVIDIIEENSNEGTMTSLISLL